MSDHQTGPRLLDRSLKPQNPFQVQVIGGFVKKQHIRRGDESRCDGQPLFPSTGKRGGRYGSVLEFGPAEHQFQPRGLFVVFQRRAGESCA